MKPDAVCCGTNDPAYEALRLETLLERGEVQSALILKGDFTDAEREMIRRAYEAGFQHARAALASPEARKEDA